jgi:hypothetical protein
MLLSKRRLVFTPTQMYFQCLHSHCAEAVLPYSDSFYPEMKSYSSQPSLKDHLRLFPSHGIGTQAEDIYFRLEEFSRRELSYSSDTLVAFYGIFNAYRRLRVVPVFLNHFWGIPILGAGAQVSTAATFARGLLWQSNSDSNLKRHGQWPSWSWTANSAPVSFPRKSGTFYLQESIQVSVNLLNGSEMALFDFAAGGYDPSNFHSYINVTSWVLRSRLVHSGRFPFGVQGINPEQCAGRGVSSKLACRARMKYREITDIMVVYLGLASNSIRSVLWFLVLEEAESGIWKRVACWASKVSETEWDTQKRGADELRSLLPDLDPTLGQDWEYKTVRIA